MPRPRRCQVRAGQYHNWTVAGEQFLCGDCKEPGPDVNDVLLLIWDVRAPMRNIADRATLLQVLIGRAEGVLFELQDAAAVMEAELAAAGDGKSGLPAPSKPTLGRELAFFQAKRQLWIETGHLNQWCLVQGRELIGFYPSFDDALQEGMRRFGAALFLVKQLLLQDPVESIAHVFPTQD